MEVVIRGGTQDDMSFIYSTWLRGLYHGSNYYSEIDRQAYFKNKSRDIRNTLLKASSSLRIACIADSPEVILGYAVLDWANTTPVLHWVYVKSAFRGKNIAKQLLEGAAIDTVTHITDLGNEIRKKKKLKFNPYLGGV